MSFDPQKFFIGLMDLYSALLPGTLLTCLLIDDEFAGFPSKTNPKYYGHPEQQHAELNALSEVLYAREIALGLPRGSATADDLSALLLHVQQVRASSVGQPMPRCSRCNYITEGVPRTSQLSGGERQQFQSILNGQWPDDRPF